MLCFESLLARIFHLRWKNGAVFTLYMKRICTLIQNSVSKMKVRKRVMGHHKYGWDEKNKKYSHYEIIEITLTQIKSTQWKKGTLIKTLLIITLQVIKNEACNFIKKQILEQVFFCKFCIIFNKTFSWNTSGRLPLTVMQTGEIMNALLLQSLYFITTFYFFHTVNRNFFTIIAVIFDAVTQKVL